MLTSIEERYFDEALSLLRWLAFAREPLTLAQLAAATFIRFEATDLNEGDQEPANEDLESPVNILGGLVVIASRRTRAAGDPFETASGTHLPEEGGSNGSVNGSVVKPDMQLRLAHFSVKEYLTSNRILESDARRFYLAQDICDQYLASSCMQYLLDYSTSPAKEKSRKDSKRFPLLLYAARSWFIHLRQAGCVDTSLAMSLLSNQQARRDWTFVCDPDLLNCMWFHPSMRQGTCWYYASYLGLTPLVQMLVKTESDIDASAGWHGNALQAASYAGHDDTVSVLLDSGANVNTQPGIHGSALQAASRRGRDKVVRLLLDAGADVGAQGTGVPDALLAASEKGHDKIVRMLLDAKADADAKAPPSQWFRTPLIAAAQNGHESVVQMLLDEGADVNADGGATTGPALIAAVSRPGSTCSVKLVQMLLDAGADIHAPITGTCALIRAIVSNNGDVVSALLKAGADPNVRNGHHGTALHIAMQKEGEAKVGLHMVQMLLDAGADVNAEAGTHGSALFLAIWHDLDDLVSKLLGAGADVNADALPYSSDALALDIATMVGKDTLVQKLLALGARRNWPELA